MILRKTIVPLVIAAFLVPAAGPAMAAKDSSDGYAVKAQKVKKSKSAKSKKACVKTAPPFMYNPRFMNRGFFKCRNR